MANTVLTYSNYQNKSFRLLGLLCLALSLMHNSDATQFTVGGSKGWGPSSPDYNQWAENSRFAIGDSLVFVYPSGKDSVLRVNNNDYANCNTDKPIEKYTDGHSVIQLKQSGPHYFISGNKNNCQNNEKLVVTVLADRSNRYSNQTNAPPPGSNGTIPSPAPSTEESPPPPAGGSVNINPAPSPESAGETPPPPNGASSLIMSIAGCIGAFAASTSLLLVF